MGQAVRLKPPTAPPGMCKAAFLYPLRPRYRPQSERSHSKSRGLPARWKVYGPVSERGQIEDQSRCPTARPPGSMCSSLVPGRIYRQCSTGRCTSLQNGRKVGQQGHSGPQKSLCVNWRWTAWERLQAPPGVSPYPFSRENIHSTVLGGQRERCGGGIPLSDV